MKILTLCSRRTVPFWKFYIARFGKPFRYPLSYCFPFLLEPCPVHQIITSDCRHPSLQARRSRRMERWMPSSNSLSSGLTFRSSSRSAPLELKPTCRTARLPHSLSIRTDDASPFGDFPTHDRVLPSAHPIIGPVARDLVDLDAGPVAKPTVKTMVPTTKTTAAKPFRRRRISATADQPIPVVDLTHVGRAVHSLAADNSKPSKPNTKRSRP